MNLYHLCKFSLYLSFTVHYLYKKVSSFTPLLSITSVSSCFYLLIFYFEKFSTWIWGLPFAISLTLNLSKHNNKIYHRVKRKNHHISQLLCKHTTYLLKLVIIASNPNKIFPQCSVCWFHHSGFLIANTRQGVCTLPGDIFQWDPSSLILIAFFLLVPEQNP